MPTIHVFTHTHWDREWFLPADVVVEMLDELFERLFPLLESTPDYRYLLDGQTLMLEDYLRRHPEKQPLIKRYAHAGQLLLGPYYGQNDWRAVSEEALVRNLYVGLRDARSLGRAISIGWIADNFGYCAQTPQIHRLFGLEDVFVWRGPVLPGDELATEFRWVGSNGDAVMAHFLMSGYRNFYNLTDTPDYIDQRVAQNVAMLRPFAPHDHLIFLDGYDTDAWPEDPFQFLAATPGFRRATPETYVRTVAPLLDEAGTPEVRGELYSGKYACIFPGTLSSRTSLRVANDLIERLLAHTLEPLLAVARRAGADVDVGEVEWFWRDLMKTHLHDDIGGVSVDQVHDAMSATYRRLFEAIGGRVIDALGYVAPALSLAEGSYAYCPSPFAYEPLWRLGDQHVAHFQSSGTGVFAVNELRPLALEGPETEAFTWRNAHYKLRVTRDGVTLNGRPAGQLTLERDDGDTYNADPRPLATPPAVTTTALQVLDADEGFARLRLRRAIRHGDIVIETDEIVFVNESPLVEWRLSIDSWGGDYRLRFVYETGLAGDDAFARMPFEVTQRPRRDDNYFGRDLPAHLRPVLLAARELDGVADFPFQGFAALHDGEHTRAVLARGLREYEADAAGAIRVTLRRAVEWLAKSDLRTRVGDAGPYMYVPGAREERRTEFTLGLIDMDAGVRSPTFLKWAYQFDYGFLLFANERRQGDKTAVRLWPDNLPWSGVHNLDDGGSLLRVYNPYAAPHRFNETATAVDPFGQAPRPVRTIAPGEIAGLHFEPAVAAAPSPAPVRLVDLPTWPVGADHGVIDDAQLAALQTLADRRRAEQSAARERLAGLVESDDPLAYHRTQHTIIRLEREILEGEVSILLNRLRRQPEDAPLREQLRVSGKRLNLVRRQRRTYDYILSIFENPPTAVADEGDNVG